MRILIVEDEHDLATVLRHGLLAEGYAVDVAQDGRMGYHLAATGAYGVIVLDLMLPSMNGFQISQRLRADGVGTPILVLTAKDGTYDQLDALDGGADDYLVKPFNYPVLLARIRALARRDSRVPTAVQRVGDLTVDSVRRTCMRGGVSVGLTPREFALLDLLARAEQRPIGKQDILLQLWPDEVDEVNLVEARISALRRKIDRPFARQSVQTVRGFGYRLVDDGPAGQQ
ncbi:response regulator transcription factor [Rugosimonospora africana]|nr:response regulator transcription factor [Rugosimonospora africana]